MQTTDGVATTPTNSSSSTQTPPEQQLCAKHAHNCDCQKFTTPNSKRSNASLPISRLAMLATSSGCVTTTAWRGGKRTGFRDTPPAKRFQKVRNPFEPYLADKLHKPLIDSPSLFYRPTTPQMSSTQFEWTIDEVSSLKPADLEPHETQFENSPNPELESRAQLAISSFFKEQKVVPSPADCPLRKQRIRLAELNGNTPIAKPGRRIRDASAQTELSLPPVLPAALEAALRPYLRVDLSGVGVPHEPQRKYTDLANCSMRRKLFDLHNVVVLEHDDVEPATSTFAGSSPQPLGTTIAGKLSDSPDSDKHSFGALSPIANSDGFSPAAKGNRFARFMGDVTLSPIAPNADIYAHRNTAAKVGEDTLAEIMVADQNDGDDDVNFTPERSSSPLQAALNITVGSGCTRRIGQLCVSEDDKDDISMLSDSPTYSNLNMSTSDTPKASGRYDQRRNLSNSFEAADDDLDVADVVREEGASLVRPTDVDTAAARRGSEYRADSGFNETNATGTSTAAAYPQ